MVKLDYLRFCYGGGSRFSWNSWSDLHESFNKVFPELSIVNCEMPVQVDSVGRYGYDSTTFYGDDFTRMDSSNNLQMGIFVEVQSHGLYAFAQLMYGKYFDEYVLPDGSVNFLPLVSMLYERKCTFSRIDLAYDDESKTFLPSELNMLHLKGQIIGESHHRSCYSGERKEDGDTFYCGKRSSGRYLRVYDKSKESNGRIDAVRWEFEFKKDWANKVAAMIKVNDGHFDFMSMLSSFMQIKQEDERINTIRKRDALDYQYVSNIRSLAPVLPEWDLFVKHELNDSNVIIEKPKESTIDRKLDDIIRKAKPVAKVFESLLNIGFDPEAAASVCMRFILRDIQINARWTNRDRHSVDTMTAALETDTNIIFKRLGEEDGLSDVGRLAAG